MMRILQLISSSGFFGAESMVLQLSKALGALGYSAIIGVFHDRHRPNLELAEQAEACGLTVQLFECNGRWDWGTVRLVRESMRENQVRVVHSHGYKANVYARLAGRGLGIRRISTCHNWIESSMKMRFYNALDRLNMRGFDAVAAVSVPVRDKLLDAGVPAGRIAMIRNGIDTGRFYCGRNVAVIRREFGFDAGDKVVGTVGRLSPEKGHADFLRACRTVLARDPRCRFLIVGDGPLKKELVSQARELGDRIIFAGQRQDIAGLLAVMDVFVLSSWTEGQPMALLEAMAAGRPIVATAVGDVPAMLRNGEAGILVSPGDIDGIADGIMRHLHDETQALMCSENARREVNENHSSAVMAREYLKIYAQE